MNNTMDTNNTDYWHLLHQLMSMSHLPHQQADDVAHQFCQRVTQALKGRYISHSFTTRQI